ncbi:hypothetical protein JCM17960_00880 [Magnetospira thiophila]
MLRLAKFGLLLMLAIYPVTPVSASETLILNTGIRDPFTTGEQNGFIDRLIQQAFLRMGKEATVSVYQKSAKALENANLGIDDGAALRIKGLEETYPNLVRVPEKLMDNQFVIYGLNKPVTAQNWADLDGLNIAYIKGWQVFQNNLKDHKTTTLARNPQHLFDLLISGQVDYILYERWQGLWRARQFGITLTTNPQPLVETEMFVYMHKKHRATIEPLAQALAKMKQDGTYQAIFDQTLGRLVP